MANPGNDYDYDYSRLAACGNDVRIATGALVRHPELATIGSHVAIDAGFYCTTSLELGDHIHVAAHAVVIGGAGSRLRMGHFSGMSPGCRVICASDDFLGSGLISPTVPPEFRSEVTTSVVTLEMFVQLGTNVVVHPGVTLGEGSVVGSCSLVTEDTEPWTVYVGIPARPRKARPRDRLVEAARRLGYLQA